ncbi:MAG: hypothetical protein OXI67_13865, partial [Candidatus Poribacteria bacterium]|nr:hypothetical protein [Candidatus Poribacteria bacterium]
KQINALKLTPMVRFPNHTIGVNLVIHVLVGWVEPQVKPNISRLSKRFMLGFVPQPNLQDDRNHPNMIGKS